MVVLADISDPGGAYIMHGLSGSAYSLLYSFVSERYDIFYCVLVSLPIGSNVESTRCGLDLDAGDFGGHITIFMDNWYNLLSEEYNWKDSRSLWKAQST